MVDIYSVEGYRKKIDEIHEIEKNINTEIENYTKSIDNKENTITIEKKIEELLNKFKSQWDEVDLAYQNKNVPTLIPNGVRERRQIEIQNLNSSIYKQSKERYESLKSKKYSYDFSEFDKKNYNTMEEYKNKSGEQLIQESKEKIKKQNQHLDDIGLNVNKAKVYVKETQHMLSKQNDQLEYIQQNVRIFFNFF
jgi:hypothetical protein